MSLVAFNDKVWPYANKMSCSEQYFRHPVWQGHGRRNQAVSIGRGVAAAAALLPYLPPRPPPHATLLLRAMCPICWTKVDNSSYESPANSQPQPLIESRFSEFQQKNRFSDFDKLDVDKPVSFGFLTNVFYTFNLIKRRIKHIFPFFFNWCVNMLYILSPIIKWVSK